MQIHDKYNLMQTLLSAAKDSQNEECALSVGIIHTSVPDKCCEILDYCLVDVVGGARRRYSLTIPKEMSYALISLCQKTGQVPIIIHTHPKCLNDIPVNFSPQDIKFINRFVEIASAHSNIKYCLFIVTDGIGIEYCLFDTLNMTYRYERGLLNESYKF